MKVKINPKAAVAFAVFCCSMTAIIIRMLKAPAITVIFFRELFSVTIASIIFFAAESSENKKLSFKDYKYAIFAGIAFSVYILSWVFSVRNTTIACATVISDMHPVFVVSIMFLLFKEKTKGKAIAGIFTALAGCVIIVGTDLLGIGNGLKGDLFALLTAFSTAVFLIFGSEARKKMSATMYLLFYNIVCFIAVGIVALITQTPLAGYPANEYLLMLLLAFVVTILGHGIMGWALKFLKPSFVSLMFLLEPIFASIMAFVLFLEIPDFVQLFGCMVIMLGIFIYNNT